MKGNVKELLINQVELLYLLINLKYNYEYNTLK